MGKGLRTFILSFYEACKSIWEFTIISGESVTVKLGNLIVGILIFFIGWRLIRYLKVKIIRNFFKKWIRDDKTREWTENFTSFLSVIVLFIIFLLITGFPVSIFSFVWHLSLFTIKDNPVELGNVIMGLVLFYIGIRLSRYISGEFQSIFLGRTHLDIATKKSLEAIFRYLLIIIVVLFVLTIVGIPLTAFTVIGGAFAIGIGLGSQHLVNNFLSGLVLMIERPLKVGDIVEMENEGGVVEHIGGRSTRIKTFKNLRMVVPNSKLLENTVINWSLIDNYLRREINVGVIYGSPVKKVSSLIMKAVKEHKKVEKNPEPLVLFTDFGESALIFKVLFWIRIREFVNTLVIESDIRYRIDEFFREAGIIIAFPQQDVHFDSLKPIELKIISENKVSKQKTTNNTKSQEK